ncbi:MAG: acyltransferase [Clostridia bacterium]|nr:acyltransferase [Clostridia bacterium]
MTKKYASLQVLRGIAAVMIVIGHATETLGKRCGAGVEMFFIISGFVMMYSTEKGLDSFFLRRAVRLVPLYWIVTGAFVVLVRPDTFTPAYFLRSLFFIEYRTMPILSVGWTLNVEVRFYILFWLAALIGKKYRGAVCAVLCAGWCAVNVIFFRGGCVPPLMPLAFVMGIAVYYLRRVPERIPRKPGHMISAALLVILSLWFVNGRLAGRLLWDGPANAWSLWRPLVYGIPALVVMMSVMYLIRDGSGAVTGKLARLGDMSYSLYLWHIVVQSLIVIFFEKVGYTVTPPSTLRFMALTLTASLVVAYYSYKYVEKPMTDWLRGKLPRGKKRADGKN